jgi:hypothetical protein
MKTLKRVCIVSLALLPTVAWCYTQLGNDRVLLMNNDTNIWNEVSCQGYNDTNTTAETYWVHSSEAAPFAMRPVKIGRRHTLYRNAGDGNHVALWHLSECRAGSASSTALARNYISWSPTAESINGEVYNISTNNSADGIQGVGTVSMCNTTDARIYSPYYEDGVGAVYFDAVNSHTNVFVTLRLELATNVLDSAASGVTLSSTNYDQFAWFPCPVDVVERARVVNGTRVRIILTILDENVEDILLDSTYGGDRRTRRVRANVYSFLGGYRGPIRFRVVRLDMSTLNTNIDNNYALVDNIVASYPPMMAEIHTCGTYDGTATGTDVSGWTGCFSVPYLSPGLAGVKALAECSYPTNGNEEVSAADFELSNVQFIYRWRYLNQQIGEWQTSAMEQVGDRLVSADGFTVPDREGDLEFYFTADQSAPHYETVDYATGTKSETAYGTGWTEAVTQIVSKASNTLADALPSGGTDWFTRIRAGASEYASISLAGEITTNGTWGVDMHSIVKNERQTMELVADHVWRYHYHIPTNAIGERIRFHFEGAKYAAGDEPFKFNVTTNVWYASSPNVPCLPYTMAASGSAADAFNAEVELDGSATHLLIEFNDETAEFAISRASYQDFNGWTDATVGYRMNAGASDSRRRHAADINNWTPTSYERPTLWREAFEVDDDDERYPYYRPTAPNASSLTTVDAYGAWTTPNGWNAENSAFVPRERIAPFGHSIQLMGGSKGSLMLNNLPAQYIPNGIGEVEFAARVAQVPSFDGFCYNFDDTQGKNYAISAKVTMSQLYDNITSTHRNPLDISPANPSVSLVGYYRGTLLGCYEFRVTRSGDQQLTVALYRWRKGEATELVKNVLNASGNAMLASGQTGLNVGGTLASWTTGGTAYNSFNNLLIPKNTDDVRKNNERWTCMCFSLYTDDSGEVRLDGFLSTAHNTSHIAADSSTVRVIAYRDAGSDLKYGSFGIGSVGCQAGFGLVYTHDFMDSSNYNQGLNVSVVQSSDYAEWSRDPDRWMPYNVGDTVYNASGFKAVIPEQTVKLMFQKQGYRDGWIDSGWETNIAAFATNTFVFAPCVASDCLVRLQTGSSDADVVIDSVEVKSWRASDMPNLSSQNGHYDEWVYTMASIETSAEIEGASYKLEPAGTNGYAFIFNEAGVVTFTPQIDMVIDRVLLVGGGGAGGWTIGGGGGGGGVLEHDWESAPVTMPAGTTVRIVVGAGGDNFYKNNNDSSNWKTGGNGGFSRVTGIPGKGTLEVKGGGGGAGWSQRNGASGQATGGGAAQGNDNGYYSGRASGTAGQGNSGGRAYGDRAGGGGGADLTELGMGQDGNATDDKAGDGGAGRASDITGTTVYYGGGGGGGAGDGSHTPNSAMGGAGGIGGGGDGPPAKAALTDRAYMDGTDGLGGGGAGGSHGGAAGTSAGGRGGCGCVILRVRTASKVCVLQPTRSEDAESPIGLRSPFMCNGLSTFGFSYRNADSNAVLRLQISTSLVDEGEVYSRTREPADSPNWMTLTNWSFKGLSAKDLSEGTRTYFISLRSPQKGLMRLIMDPSVVSNALSQSLDSRDLNYGKITITRVFCYDEPPLDPRSWLGWNIHTEGWDGSGGSGLWANLSDAPDGLSCSLNFSALADDNKTTDPATYGIGLDEPDKTVEYAENNPFVQSPAMSNGIGSVTFKARTFETNAMSPSVVILYGTNDPEASQTDSIDGLAWVRLAEFVISNNTYQTYSWRTNEMTTAIRSIRLEVGGARNGRGTSYAPLDKAWEKPSYTPYRPIQRVFIDDVSVSEILPETLDEPTISMMPYNGSFYFSEQQVGSINGRVNVNLNIAPTEPIEVEITVVRDGASDGLTSDPVLNTNRLTFTSGSTSKYFYFKELDGDANFIVSARVITGTQSVDPNKTWAQYYRLEEDSGYPMTVVNDDPMIQGVASTNAVPAGIGVPTRPISWTAKDVLPDIREGMTASWTVEGATVDVPITMTNSTGTTLGTVGGSYSPVFTTPGTKTVTLTVMDKDGGCDIRYYYFEVEAPPVLIDVDFGGQAKLFSTDWIAGRMGLSSEWVKGHSSLVKSLLGATAANGRLSVVECYALGIDPEDPDVDFVITEFPMKANGMPDLSKLKYEPSSDNWELPNLTIRVMGATDLLGPWSEVTDGGEPGTAYRFFKVEVVVP